jgi:hypothetical protein
LEVTNWKNKADTETMEIIIVNEVIPTVAINGLGKLHYTTSASILVGLDVSVGKNLF